MAASYGDIALLQDWNKKPAIISTKKILVFIVVIWIAKLSAAIFKSNKETLRKFLFYLGKSSSKTLKKNTSTTTTLIILFKRTSPDKSGDVELMGTLFIWFFNPNMFEA